MYTAYPTEVAVHTLMKYFCVYLVVQVPGLIVFLCAFPVEDGLVVYFDELPVRTVAEVAKKANDKNNDAITLNYKQRNYTCMYWMWSLAISPNKKKSEWSQNDTNFRLNVNQEVGL